MTERDQKQLGKTLWNIAARLRGAMNADDSRECGTSAPPRRRRELTCRRLMRSWQKSRTRSCTATTKHNDFRTQN